MDIRHGEVLPGPNGSVWVIQSVFAGLEAEVTLVQRYDSEGYPEFEGAGIRVTESLVLSELLGAFPASDGGVIIAFRSANIDSVVPSSMYGQWISVDGERLWGPNGAGACVTDMYQDAYPRYPSTCTDENDGFWGFFFEAFTCDAYVYGLNSDGTPKVAEPLLVRPEEYGESYEVAIGPDGEGGAFVVFLWIEMSNIRTRLQHVYADGTLQFYLPQVMWEAGTAPHMYPLPFPGGGGYVVEQEGRGYGMVRFNSVGIGLWDEMPIFYPGGGSSCRISRPVVMADSSVLVLASSAHGSTELTRVRPDGSPWFEQGYHAQLRTYNDPMNGSPDEGSLALSPDTTFAYCVLMNVVDPAPDVWSNIRVQRVRLSDGCEQWPEIVWVLQDPYHAHLCDVWASTMTDSSLVIMARDPSWEAVLCKVYPDGTVAGQESVDDRNQSTPAQFHLLDVYPNPFNNSVTCHVELSISENLTLSLYTLEGKCLHREAAHFDTGSHRWTVNFDHLHAATGTYFLECASDRHHETKKIVLVR